MSGATTGQKRSVALLLQSRADRPLPSGYRPFTKDSFEPELAPRPGQKWALLVAKGPANLTGLRLGKVLELLPAKGAAELMDYRPSFVLQPFI